MPPDENRSARRSTQGVLVGFVCWLIHVPPLAADEPQANAVMPEPAKLEFFEKQVRPLLATRCHECHGPLRQKGGLRLDSLAAALAGGDSGPAVVPGKPDESTLIDAVRYGQVFQMPPKGKLPDAEVAALVAWVRLGAPWPKDGAGAESLERPIAVEGVPSFTVDERAFWAFQPPVDPPSPPVMNSAWPKNPLDVFILAGLEARGLSPAPPADKRTLIRRATFDLIGLPPTPDEVESFLADESPDAFGRVVDRLLDSPQYGERWGRHWLDVTRYADSNGLDENLAYVNAFRYRDYVVSAFNRDLPFDQFVIEQLAGDLLPPDADEAIRHERLVATGFLTLGAKMLAEDDPVKMEMDIIDEQIDTIGTTFMGLTLGCARCHDHKFDPIPTADYYSLAGIFKSTKTMDNFNVVAVWHERPLAAPEQIAAVEAHREHVARKKGEIDGRVKAANDASMADIRRDASALPAQPKADNATAAQDELARLRDELTALEKAAPPPLPLAMAVEDRAVTDVRVHIRGNHLTQGEQVPRRFPRIIAGDDQPPLPPSASGRLELARWLVRPDHPLTSRVMVNRVWRGHFGEGLVRTPDNFGRLGERPTHPELLDWLARRFVEQDWSLKSLHRLIMHSATYQMSAAYSAAAAAADPDNRLLWRKDRRRLEAEAIRDTILATSGRLELSLGGSLLKASPRQYVASTNSVDIAQYESFRRSLYLPVVRSALYDVFQAFDFAEPSVANGGRASTTVAPQALFMMNSPIVAAESRHLAATLLAEFPADDAARVGVLYARDLGRPPSAVELSRALAFVGQMEASAAWQSLEPAERRLRALQSLCRVVMSSSEFIYVE
ncbi:MAG TPA: PSD1 and planctomycete cytochrome C domain-containing protein [Pirellulales bacterium]|nr:PSD1 and planctomycete cytochrome C domain-containing protein [Pirellulales bacterium]